MAFNVISAEYHDSNAAKQNLVGASEVPHDSPLDITFNSAVASSSILSYAVTLFRTMADGGNETPVDIGLTQPADAIVRITPAADLITGASYTVYIPKSNYGITAADGTTLQNSFSGSFTVTGTVADVVETGTSTVEDLSAIPEELYLSSSIPSEGSIMQYGLGSITVSFDGRVPDGGTCSDTEYTTKATCEAASETWTKDVIITAEATKPLGFTTTPLTTRWIDNLQDPLIVGKDVYLTSKVDYSSLTEAEVALLAVIGVDTLSDDSIVCIDKVADGDGNITLDFDVNRAFEIGFDISVNEHVPTLAFMSLLSPFYASINETKLEIGPFVNQYDDFTVALSIHRHGITAAQLWNGTIDSLDVPIRITEYVIARTKKDILSTYFTDPTGAGAGSISLGDFKMSGGVLAQYLKDNIAALDLKIVALEHKLKTKDTSSSPYTDHTHQSLPTSTTSASPGETAGTDFGSLKGASRGFTSQTKSSNDT